MQVRTWDSLPNPNFTIYTKITNFGDFFKAVRPHFKSDKVKFGTRVREWESLPMPNFVLKKSLKGQIYTKNYQFWRFWRL